MMSDYRAAELLWKEKAAWCWPVLIEPVEVLGKRRTDVSPLGWASVLEGSPNRSPRCAPMSITHLFAGVAVSDFATARRWYETLFGRSPDMLPKKGEAVWRVTAFGSIYITADPAGAGSALVTIAVSNLDEHATALAARGLSLDEQGVDPSALRRLTITDYDGNRITFFQDHAQPTA